MDKKVFESVSDFFGSTAEINDIISLYGDASYRTYFRIVLNNGKGYIAMKMPEGASSASEEITNYRGKKGDLPYINISNYLSSLKINVPRIIHYDKFRAILILEDLGDRLFFDEVAGADEKEKGEFYQRAIDLLVELQVKTAKTRGSIAFERSFDEILLDWEFDHFLEYGVETRMGRVPKGVRDTFIRETRAITEKIVKMNYGFTHRDFQSRNIMVKDKNFWLIDFQDALRGPTVYDLVALLKDSYVEISDEMTEGLIKYYAMKRGLDFNNIHEELLLVTIQRKLKDAGRFVYIDRVKGNSKYLQFISRSLGHVKKALLETANEKLFELLVPYVPEFKG